MNQQERTSLLQSIGKFIKAQFAGYERRLELAEQKAAQALALDIDARIKLATLEAVTAVTQKMQADLEGARAAADEAARKALDMAASLRQPEDGKSVTADELLPMLEDLVGKCVADIPAPPAPDPEIIRGMVQEAVAAIPKPKDGKDADPEQIERAISEAVAKIPMPKDGKGVTVEELLPVIQESVKREVSALPRPKDGQSVTLDDVRPLIEGAVKDAAAYYLEGIPVPKDGQPGRDALQLEILPSIDPAKSYPRGSYARHAGGLWRAYETTHGMRGWECIVEGIAEHRIEQVDERTIEAVSVLSSGCEVRKSISVPAVIDRGIYTADLAYKSGDGVTWGGSYWIATKNEPVGKPGEPGSDGWRLAVKRGRDGKDGRNGIDKTAPVRVDK